MSFFEIIFIKAQIVRNIGEHVLVIFSVAKRNQCFVCAGLTARLRAIDAEL